MARERQTREMELRLLLTEIATSQERLSRLTDDLSARRRAIREAEARKYGFQLSLSAANEGSKEIKEEAKKRLKAALAEHLGTVERFKAEMAPLQRECDDIADRLEKLHARRVEIETALDRERKQRCAEVVREAALASNSRDAFLEAREKLYRLRAKLSATEHELSALMTATKLAESVEDRAETYLKTETIPAEVPELTDSRKRLISEVKTLSAALKMQEREVREREQVYGAELAASLRPALAAIAQKISDSIEIARNSTFENHLVRVAFAVELGGADECLPAINFLGILTPYRDASDSFSHWQTRMRCGGFVV